MTETRWLDPAEQLAWRSYLDATRLLLRALDQQLSADAGISFTDYELLVVLSESPHRRLRMSELADAATTTRSGVTRAIDRLVKAGWVERVEVDDDKRGKSAELTPAGIDKLALASPGHVAEVRRRMFDVLSPEDVAVFGHAYRAMRDRMLTNP